MSNVDAAQAVLNKRLEALETARQYVDNQLAYINELRAVQDDRSNKIEDEAAEIYAALRTLEAAFPTPREDYDDIPF